MHRKHKLILLFHVSFKKESFIFPYFHVKYKKSKNNLLYLFFNIKSKKGKSYSSFIKE